MGIEKNLLSTHVSHMVGYMVFTIHDHRERFTIIGFLEGGTTSYQHEQDHTQTPHICRKKDKLLKHE